MISKKDFRKISDWLWEIPKSFRPDMRVPARIYVSEKMLEEIFRDQSIPQLINGCTLPGIVKYGVAMPDCHEGYSVPIGFVGAMRTSDGIISPGACGFDINCLSSETKVLLEQGVYISIRELEKMWKDQKVKFVKFKEANLEDSEVICFLKEFNNPTIYRIITQSGKEIEATGDHPIQTKEGMREVKILREGDFVLIYPFEGVRYQKPPSRVILTEEKYKKISRHWGKRERGNTFTQIFNQIKSRNLLPLSYDHPALPYILKLMGYIFGDGSISFSKSGKAQIQIYGKPEDLREIQKDIAKLGFKPPKIYSRKRHHSVVIITTFYQTCKFSSTEHFLKISSFGLAALLVALGTPYGLKSHKPYRIPKWIFKCPLWQKRLFLASFFGAVLSAPSPLNKYNFYAPQLKELGKNGKLFLKDIATFLKEFEIETDLTKEVPRKGETFLRLQIKEKTPNLIKFFETLNYEYNQEKQKEACLAANYLKRKLKIAGLKTSKEKRKLSPNFPSFKEFRERYAYGKKGLAWEEIIKIEKIPYHNFVYDFTIKEGDHNFIANNFVVSNCGMKLLKSEHSEKEIKPYLENLATEIQKEVPSGLGRGGQIKLSIEQINKILEGGAKRLVEQGYGEEEDIENCEANGKLEWADASAVSSQAKNRGRDQVGTLGSGNHFLEIQKIEEIFDEELAKVFGLFKDQIVIMIHTGSRGLGHQVCTDYLREFIPLMERKYKIKVPDREFACVPFNSPEGQRYFGAMASAANYAWANRQMIAHFIGRAWKSVLGEKISSLSALYDVAHNIIKKEKYFVEEKEIEVVIHRKGATRAFPPGHSEVPKKHRTVGQCVLIPGSMGSASYILVGQKEGKEAFFSTCHGAGRTMSRHAATRTISGQEVVRGLESKGIVVKCWSRRGIAEEAPAAYKDIDRVVEVVCQAGLSKKVAKLVSLAVIKGE